MFSETPWMTIKRKPLILTSCLTLLSSLLRTERGSPTASQRMFHSGSAAINTVWVHGWWYWSCLHYFPPLLRDTEELRWRLAEQLRQQLYVLTYVSQVQHCGQVFNWLTDGCIQLLHLNHLASEARAAFKGLEDKASAISGGQTWPALG